MKVKELLAGKIGERIGGGFELSIKTYKKCWQVGNKWISQVILMDETGEIPADIDVGDKYHPIRGRGISIKIIVAEIQEAEYLGKDRKKLYVEQFRIPTQTMSEFEEEQATLELKWDKEIKGKIRHGLTCSLVKGKQSVNVTKDEKQKINELVKFIETGEMK